MTEPAEKRQQSPSQTVGPFFHQALIEGGEHILVRDETRGERIRIVGRVLDGDGQPILDAMLEVWQADANGRYAHPNDPDGAQADPHFLGFGRAATNADGGFEFQTIKPGARDGVPFVNVRVFARGLLIHAVTRMYFPDEPLDAVLEKLPPERRQTLIAARDGTTYRFDIRMQGELETVFFDV